MKVWEQRRSYQVACGIEMARASSGHAVVGSAEMPA